jgi:L-serine/L-threonine ammonia-lyase
VARSVECGERIELPAISSIATSLGAKQVGVDAFDVAKAHPGRAGVRRGPGGTAAERQHQDWRTTLAAAG